MLLTALPPAPPTPNTVNRGFSSRISGIFRLMLIFASCLGARPATPPCRAGQRRPIDETLGETSSEIFAAPLEALPQPSSDSGDVARSCHRVPRSPRFE